MVQNNENNVSEHQNNSFYLQLAAGTGQQSVLLFYKFEIFFTGFHWIVHVISLSLFQSCSIIKIVSNDSAAITWWFGCEFRPLKGDHRLRSLITGESQMIRKSNEKNAWLFSSGGRTRAKGLKVKVLLTVSKNRRFLSLNLDDRPAIGGGGL